MEFKHTGAANFTEMAEDVQRALKSVRECEWNVEQAEKELDECRAELEEVRATFNRLRDAFHKEFPEMAPSTGSLVQQAGTVVGAVPPQAPVEEAQPDPVMTPQGPVVFREMDDSPFGDAQ